MDGLKFPVVYGDVSDDATSVICHQLGLLCTDLHEAKCRDIAPPGHRTFSFPRQSRGGVIAFVVNNLIVPFSSTKTNFSFSYLSLELAQLSSAFPHQSFHLFCLYRPSPSSKNGLKDSLFMEEFSELFHFVTL